MNNGADTSFDGAEARVAEPQATSQPSPAAPHDVQPTLPPAHLNTPERALPARPKETDVFRTDISVIGADLTITGQDVHIVSKGKIRVEGRIQGDVLGTEVVIGDVGEVEGVVSGDTVRVFGVIMGTIRGVQVEIEAGAKVEADVHHHSLSVDARAQVEGRVRRARDAAELKSSAAPVEVHEDGGAPSPEAEATRLRRNGRLWR